MECKRRKFKVIGCDYLCNGPSFCYSAQYKIFRVFGRMKKICFQLPERPVIQSWPHCEKPINFIIFSLFRHNHHLLYAIDYGQRNIIIINFFIVHFHYRIGIGLRCFFKQYKLSAMLSYNNKYSSTILRDGNPLKIGGFWNEDYHPPKNQWIWTTNLHPPKKQRFLSSLL